MSQKPQVRIVKRDRQEGGKKPAGRPAAPKKKETRSGARAVAENVSSWVEEFKERRRTDDGRSFASLFSRA